MNAPNPLKDVKAPQFLNDLFRDMRDRGLLPVAGLLLVAILAVPFLLGGGKSAPSPAPVAAGGAAGSPAESGAAVVVSDEGIRVTGERKLGSKKDPFNQQFRIVDTTGSALGVGLAGPTTKVSGSSSTGSGSSSAGGSGSGSGSGSDSNKSSGGESGGGGNSDDDSGGGGTTDPPEVTAASYQVDTTITKTHSVTTASTTEDKDDVGFLDALPDSSSPVFVFAGVTEDAEKALFLLPNSVSLNLTGGGVCVIPISAIPAGFACPLVALEPGDEIETTYGPDPLHTYKLKLDSIHQPS